MLNENKKRNTYLSVTLIAIFAIAFGLLLWKFDFEILFFIQNHLRNDILDVIVPFYTNLGDDEKMRHYGTCGITCNACCKYSGRCIVGACSGIF